MKLTAQEALERIQKPVNDQAVEQAKYHEGRLVMHTEPIPSKHGMPQAFQDYLTWVQQFLPGDKFKRFQQLLTFPLETVDTTEAIFEELGKVFQAPDEFLRVEFTSPAYEQDYMDYLDKLHIRNYWQTKGWEAVKHRINSFIVVDVPAVQVTPRPEPYFYLLGIENVHDVVINADNNTVEYIAFYQGGKDKVVFIEETSYRVFERKDGEDWKLIVDFQHSRYAANGDVIEGIGYTPVTSFYRTPIKGSAGINKRAPLTNALSKLDWLLTFKTSKKYLDLYGAWPIVVHYEQECTYKDAQGDACDGNGYITKTRMAVDPMDGSANIPQCYQERCPVCEAKGLMGPGTEFEVPSPRDREQADLMANPVKFIEPTNDKLEYGVKEVERLEIEIKKNTCGYVDEATRAQINEKQVESQFEGKRAILDRIREQFEHGMGFVLSTMARIRYDKLFQRSTIFLGREYFLYNTGDLIEKFKNGKSAGLPNYEISIIRETYSKTKYRDDPMQFQRTSILAQLEPYVDFSPSELRAMGIDVVDLENFYLKLEFANFIARFEREYTNIVDFGSAIPFKNKIDIIHQKLLSYVRDKNLKQPADSTQAGSQPNSRPNG